MPEFVVQGLLADRDELTYQRMLLLGIGQISKIDNVACSGLRGLFDESQVRCLRQFGEQSWRVSDQHFYRANIFDRVGCVHRKKMCWSVKNLKLAENNRSERKCIRAPRPGKELHGRAAWLIRLREQCRIPPGMKTMSAAFEGFRSLGGDVSLETA